VSDADQQVAAARHEARRAMIMSWVWWAQMPIVGIAYWLISTAPPIEKAILVYLAELSIIAIAVTYSSKAKAAEAKAAGYDNP
jgi:hypothetical protein